MNPASERSRRFALDARAAKRGAACAIGVDEPFIAALVDRFYAKVREDWLLGPIFADRIADWPSHLEQMKRFWRSVLHNSGEFNGSPMRKHVAIANLDIGHFSHWLRLFYDTLRELEPTAEATSHVGTKARMIADSLLTGIAVQRDGLGRVHISQELPHV